MKGPSIHIQTSEFILFSYQKTKGHDLEDTLHREENSERRVQVLQYGFIRRRGRIILKMQRRQEVKHLCHE